LNITATPNPNGFGINTTLLANVTDSDGVDAVWIEITDPNSDSVNYSMTNVSDIWHYDYSDWINGTYSYRIFANDTTGAIINSSMYTFELYVNLTVQVRTLKDIYGLNDTVNLTDPPDFILNLKSSSIEIQNRQSYPVVGDNWTVLFNTIGTEDLIISAINRTSYSADLEFQELVCGNETVDADLIENRIISRDWSCDETGKNIVKAITAGRHYQRFVFGNDIGYASNLANIIAVNITNPVAYTNDTLTCRFNITGNGSITANVTWYNHNETLKQNNSVPCTNSTYCYQVLEYNYTHHDYSIICSVSANDTDGWSGWSNSTALIISNYSTNLSVENSTSTPVNNQLVTFYVNYSSVFGDIGLILLTSQFGSGYSIEAADLDCDSYRDEIIVGAYGELFAYETSGTEIWNTTDPSGTVNEIRITAMQNDGCYDDIVIGDHNVLFWLSKTLKVAPDVVRKLSI